MDCSQLVLNVIKDPTIKANLNPIAYYTIKLIYAPNFSERSRYFFLALQTFFKNYSKSLNLDKLTSEIPLKQKTDNTFIMKKLLEQSSNINSPFNAKDGQEEDIFSSKYINILLEYDSKYILDKDDNYSLLYMLKDYIFETQDPKTSELMQGYNLFVSSVELMFCLRLILHFPKVHFMRKEEHLPNSYFNYIKDRVCKFCYVWCKEYP
jgi:hypothetical protein